MSKIISIGAHDSKTKYRALYPHVIQITQAYVEMVWEQRDCPTASMA